MSKSKWYVLTEGMYSDYRVVAIVKSKKNAKKAVEVGIADSYEKVDVLTDIPPRVSVLTLQASYREPPPPHRDVSNFVDVLPTGSNVPLPEPKFGCWDTWEDTQDVLVGDYRDRRLEVQTYKGNDKLIVSGTDFEAVRKAFSDRFGQMKMAKEEEQPPSTPEA